MLAILSITGPASAGDGELIPFFTAAHNSQRASMRPQDRYVAAPRGHGASQGGHQEARTIQTHDLFHVDCLLAVSVSLPTGSRGHKMAP